jgi:Na+(H+)/acetate symporter ActP
VASFLIYEKALRVAARADVDAFITQALMPNRPSAKDAVRMICVSDETLDAFIDLKRKELNREFGSDRINDLYRFSASLAGLLAAYVSTLVTHLNWGSSYLVHDFYRRFLHPGASEKHYVSVARLTTVVLMILASLLTFILESAKASFDLMLSIGAGTGLIYLLRWFWWRINAWSEIAAMASSFGVAIIFFVRGKLGHPVPQHISLLITIAFTTVVWLVVTFLTRPVEKSKLISFYQLVKPAGPGWNKIRQEANLEPSSDSLTLCLAGWVSGCVFVYAALFGTGAYIYGRISLGVFWTVLFVISTLALIKIISKLWSGARGQRFEKS